MNLCVSWTEYHAYYPYILKGLWNDQDFADVTLITSDNKQIRAHRVILSFGSTFFKNIYHNNIHKNSVIYLKDIDYKYINFIIRYIYTGQCEVEHTELRKFLSIVKDLKVIGLQSQMIILCQADQYSPFDSLNIRIHPLFQIL